MKIFELGFEYEVIWRWVFNMLKWNGFIIKLPNRSGDTKLEKTCGNDEE